MNLSPAESAGSSTLIEALATPPAASEPAPAAESFQSLLRKAGPEVTASGANDGTSTPVAEEQQVAGKTADEAAERPSAPDEDATGAGDDSTEQAVAVAASIVPFQMLPSVAIAENAADDAATAAGPATAVSNEAATLALPSSPSMVPVEVGAANESTDLPQPLPPELSEAVAVETAQPIDPQLATQELGEASLPFDAGEAIAGEPAHDKPDHEGRDQPGREANPPAPLAVEGSTAKAEQPAVMGPLAELPGAGAVQPPVADRPPPAPAAFNPPPGPPPAPNLPPELVATDGSRSQTDFQVASADTVRLLTRVARAFHSAQDGGEVRIRLSPPELGALRMEVRVLEGALVARLETETAAARTAIVENLPVLRERLAEQGVRIERFDVDLMQRHAGGSPDRPAERHPPESPPPSPALRPRRMPQVAEGVVVRHAMVSDTSAGRLNVIV